MIDVTKEQVFRLSELPKWAIAGTVGDGNPVRLSRSTGYRWSRHGLRGVVLETVQVGGSRFTSLEALQRFVADLTAARDQKAQ